MIELLDRTDRGLAGTAACNGDIADALEPHLQVLAFETIGDRAEEARILAEMPRM